MNTVEEQLKNINNKDDLIKWLVNAYYFHSYKLDNYSDKAVNEVTMQERQQVKAKADELLD
ncbi:hypothetical protein QI222_04000 [Staphylococcus saprophyticus]|uniref:hypothetical protein n=1 Tax=Staphylococcus saprophyticus TaxID=29385 RepID=UPI0011A044F1|nr:hypothetical protein [Staphylococcus saprophyticus]MDW4104098.1 hypothetical protein [Staphylococcus saprophyticus]MDW4205184.1 hypothetical protein [Staphylococcus saprophyticus]